MSVESSALNVERSAPRGAVFLSYASQDAEAVSRLAEALRAAGVEVWFDRNELVGGDAWDAKIRGQIATCALFVPVISAATQARLEGYFRLEWKLAAQRTHTMADEKVFLLPVVIDDTRDAEAKVPPEFRAVQWTRLRQGDGGQARDEALEKFCARVQTLLRRDVTDATSTRPSSEPDARHGRRGDLSLPPKPARRTWSVMAIVGAAAAIGVLAWWQPWRKTVRTPPPSDLSAASSAKGSAAADKSLVVLPLENLSPDPENAFFTEGMHSEITITLSRIPDLKVISRASALAFKDTKLPLAEIAQKLGVANVITGSVRRAGSTVRIQLELRRARDEALLWSSPTGDHELKDALGLQSEIADQVARVLLAREAKGLLGTARFMTKNPQAYDLFLKEQEAFFDGFRPNQSGKFAEAIRIGKEAFALDPSFMSAAQFISVANALLYRKEDDPARRAAYAAESKQWAEVSSRLAPGGVGDLAMVSHLFYVEVDFHRAVAIAETGVRALPNDSGMFNFLALAQKALGRTAEAVENFQKALIADPLTPVLNYNLLAVLADLRRTEAALTVIAKLEAMSSKSDHRAMIAKCRFQLWGEIPTDLPGLNQAEWLWRARRFDRLADYAEGQLLQPNANGSERLNLLWGLSDARARLGDSARATEVARTALALAEKLHRDQATVTQSTDLQVAGCLARLGRFDEAVAVAQRAVDAAPERSDLHARWRREVEMAALCAQVGRKQQSLDLIAKLLRVPSGLTVPMLKVDPTWDNVRDDPAFQALLADPKSSAPL